MLKISNCSFIDCQQRATIYFVHPVTGVYVESCDYHKEIVYKMMLSRRRNKTVIYSQQSLDD